MSSRSLGDLGDEVGGEREVAAVVEVIERGEREQRVELARDRGPGQVVVEAGEVAQHIDRGFRPEHQSEPGDTIGDHRQSGAGVGDDQAEVGVTGDGAAQHHVHHGPRRVEQELEHRPRPPDAASAPSRQATWDG